MSNAAAIEFLPVPANLTGRPANDVSAVVGMPARYSIGSDDYGGFVRQVERKGRTVKWARTMDEPENEWDTFTLGRDGVYKLRGRSYGFLRLGDNRPTCRDEQF
jgi:hypothetical protein